MARLYIEPFSGLSGDMMLSALCGLADAYEEISNLPERLNLLDGKVEIRELNKNGIVCKHVNIIDLNANQSVDGEEPSIFHTMYHWFFDDHNHSHSHGDGHTHSHNEDAPHRKLAEILEIIDKGDISENAKQIAKDVFMIVGKAEANIHNMALEDIHFHELSGVDSILDIVGCAVLIDALKIKKTYSDPICTGSGYVNTQHGVLPVPAPATADILQGMPTYSGAETGERITPTGAAILKYLQPNFNVPVLARKKTAYGPGQKDFIGPNVVRLSLVKKAGKVPKSSFRTKKKVVEVPID